MRRLIDWFRVRPRTTWALIAAYFAAIVLSHDLVQSLAYWLQRTVTKPVWAPFVATVFLVLAWCFGVALYRRSVGPARVAWTGSLILSGVCGVFLLATNMEAIHFWQYGLVALPVLAVVRRLGWTVLIVTLMGAFDELYQFELLHPGWAVQYDVNDVFLNAVGAALGASGAAALCGRDPAARPRRRALWAPLLICAGILGGGGAALHATGHLATYKPEAESHAVILLSRGKRPSPRWKTPKWGRGFYELHPGVAFAACALLIAAFTALDERVEV